MEPTSPDNGNNKITLAIINTKIDQILAAINEIKKCDDEQDKDIVKLKIDGERRETTIKELRSDMDDAVSDIDKLSGRDWWMSGIAGVLAFVASMIFPKGP